MTLAITPLFTEEAQEFVAQHHRHHRPPLRALFALGCSRMDLDPPTVVGVALVGRPVAREMQDGWTAEVTRLCTLDGELSKHAASKLYAGCWRAARALGWRRLMTYTLASESGTSLVAAGWRCVGQVHSGRSWDTPSRPRVDWHPTLATEDGRVRWEAL